jgi:GT2 family glycosyltransferase
MTISTAWIVVVARNNLSLLKRAIASFEAQQLDGGERPHVLVVNNGSSDGTAPWLFAHPEIVQTHFTPQKGVAHAWNTALSYIFSLGGSRRVDRVLVCNSDVVLRPDTYQRLAAERAMFVTAVGVDTRYAAMSPGPVQISERHPERRPHPDFSCFMISRECYSAVGPFDERYTPAWFEDNKYHVEMHRRGIRAYAIDLPFWHVGGGGQTIARADESERAALTRAFAANRERFIREYGCDPADVAAYEKLFTDDEFGRYARSDAQGTRRAVAGNAASPRIVDQ